MKAIYIQQHEVADLKVSELPKPALSGSDDVLVKVEASGINPSLNYSAGKVPAHNARNPGCTVAVNPNYCSCHLLVFTIFDPSKWG